MATFHCQMRVGKPEHGAAHANYICREGKYREKEEHELEYKEHGNIPTWAKDDPREFWKAADKNERSNGNPYREFEIALPRELSVEQRKELIQNICREQFGERQAYTAVMHNHQATLDGGEQPHVHIMFSDREHDGIERDEKQFFKRANKKNPKRGGAGKNDRFSGRNGKRHEGMREVREQVANQINKSLERAGHEVRVDHRTLEAQRAEAVEKGDHSKAEELDRAPERHLGPKIANKTAREVRELANKHKNPAERLQAISQYYQRAGLNERVRAVWLVRELKRTNEAIQREQNWREQHHRPRQEVAQEITQIAVRDVTVVLIQRLARIDQEINQLEDQKKELYGKYINDERCQKIAVALYCDKENIHLRNEYKALTTERKQFAEQEKRLLQIPQPAFYDLLAKRERQEQFQKLEVWRKDLQGRETDNYLRGKELDRRLATPEAQEKIAEISAEVIAKNQPIRDELTKVKERLNFTQIEKKEIYELKNELTKTTKLLDHKIELVNKPIGAQIQQIRAQAQNALTKLARAEGKSRGGMQVKLTKGKEQEQERDELSFDRGF